MSAFVPSPCIGVCRVNVKHGFCEGCFRTQSEIINWVKMDYQQQQQLMLVLEERQAQTAPAFD